MGSIEASSITRLMERGNIIKMRMRAKKSHVDVTTFFALIRIYIMRGQFHEESGFEYKK
jgi:hypothetical protein